MPPQTPQQQQSPPLLLVHHRSKTILLIVQEIEDVPIIASMCSLLGDLYRHRTYFANEPILVLRVVVPNHLRHYFVHHTNTINNNNNNNDTTRTPTVVTWRAHECNTRTSGGGRWVTHVGAPDSIWSLDEGNNGLLDAFWGRSSSSSSILTHDDGGMADMILLGPSGSKSSTLWQKLVPIIQQSINNNNNNNNIQISSAAAAASPPPLVIATLGNIKGIDWVSRIAFAAALQKEEEEYKSSSRSNRPSSESNSRKRTRITARTRTNKRSIALVGFPTPLWYCRLVFPSTVGSNKTSHFGVFPKKISTQWDQENSIVLMMGRTDSSTSHQQLEEDEDVCLIATSTTPQTLNAHQCEQILSLLRQSLFLPTTKLDIIMSPLPLPVPVSSPQSPTANITALTRSATAAAAAFVKKSYMYNLLWSLLQDPHMIQFPCYMATTAASIADSDDNDDDDNKGRPPPPTITTVTYPTKKRQTLGSLILSTFEELILVLDRLYCDLNKKRKNDDDKTKMQDDDDVIDDISSSFCNAILHPLEESLLAKLLGRKWGSGSLVEDLTNNRRNEILARIRQRQRRRHNNNNHRDDDTSLLHQRWILEPLATREALLEWQMITQHSPFHPTTNNVSGSNKLVDNDRSSGNVLLIRQLVQEHVPFGLGLVLQLAVLLGMQTQQQLPTINWVVDRLKKVSPGGAGATASTIPFEAWGIRSLDDFYNKFLLRYHPLGGGQQHQDDEDGGGGGVETVSRLLSRL